MKIKINYPHAAAKNDKPNWSAAARRRALKENSETAAQNNKNASPAKEEMKFANLLNSAARSHKNDQHGNSERDRQDEEKKERLRERESGEPTGDGKTEKYDSSAGGNFGGQSGFGERGNVGVSGLRETFAARSILHIADLERLISTIRTQAALGGKREIVIELRRSVLEGLRVKIVTDRTAKVQIEFLAANEKMRREIEKHSPELAGILRGRGVNLETLKTSVYSAAQNDDSSADPESSSTANSPLSFAENGEPAAADTFTDSIKNRDTNYRA